MKAIYRGSVWQCVGDYADGLILRPLHGEGEQRAPYSAPSLIIDPTDWELDGYCLCGSPVEQCGGRNVCQTTAAEAARLDLWEMYADAGYAHRVALQAADQAGREYACLYFRYRGE